MSRSILVGTAGTEKQLLLLNKANFHGIVAGATGTGKTTTLQSIAQKFSQQGVPVFAQDVKGDLAAKITRSPTKFWDLMGDRGQSIKISIRDLGSDLFSRLLELSESQDGIITILFVYMQDQNQKLETLDDVRRGLNWMVEDQKNINLKYGGYMISSIATIQRKLLKFKLSGMDNLFGATNFKLQDLIKTQSGAGVINILRSEELISNPVVYSTFLFWLLNQLWKTLPEVGNPDKPKMIFFFDEAHLLFADTSKNFLQTIERTVRLVRSKGVGVYFVTQSLADIPDSVLAQLGNRVQHALRAYTPNDQKGLKAAAQSFRTNPAFDTADTIQSLAVGEALTSFLQEDGTPGIVQKTRIDVVVGSANVVQTTNRKPVLKTSAVSKNRNKIVKNQTSITKETATRPVVSHTIVEQVTSPKKKKQRVRHPWIGKLMFSMFNSAVLASFLAIGALPFAAF